MGIDFKDLAFESIGVTPLKDGTNNNVFLMKTDKMPRIVKELKQESRYYKYISEDPVEVAKCLNRVQKIVKPYFGEDMADVKYIVMNGSDGLPTVVTVQQEVKRKTLTREIAQGTIADMQANKDRCQDVVDKYRDIWEKVVEDPRWKEILPRARGFLQKADISLDDIMHTTDGRYVLIDF